MIPNPMKIVIREVPPLLMKGSGAPTTGIKPVTIPILKITYKKIKKETPKIIILFTKFSYFKNSLIKRIIIKKYKINTDKDPKKPISSEIKVYTKSVCFSGKKSNLL